MPVGRARLGAARIAWAAASPESRFTIGRALLAELVTELTGATGVAIERRCARCGSAEHGAPRVRDLPVAVSVSYAGDLVAAAAILTADAVAIGIDIESDESAARVSELALLFAPRPAPDLRDWTLIEAALKADGRGLEVDPSTVRLERASALVPGRDHPIVVAAVDGPTGFVLSVAVVQAAQEGPAAPAAPAHPATP